MIGLPVSQWICLCDSSVILLPLLGCLLLVFIHVYFGSFVLRRGILFIDLALAQWAALGYLIAHYFSISSPLFVFLSAFSFTLIAGLFISLLKPLFKTVSYQEALIGVLYIFASALSIGLLSSTGMESGLLKEMLSGHLLFVTSSELTISFLIYFLVALLLRLFHSSFLHTRSFGFDFLFYALFGLVVTSSVKIAGILTVFSFLVLPLLCTVLFTQSFFKQLFIAWILGTLSSFIGVFVSLIFDLPPSICVISTLCLFFFGSILFYSLFHKKFSFFYNFFRK